MNMEWLNLPIVELAFALGGIIGLAFGFWAGYGVENILSYHRGYKSAKLKNDELLELVRNLYEQLLNAYDPKELDEFIDRMRELGIEVDE